MTRSIHYLIRNPVRTGEVIYPKELPDDEPFQGFGSFFMLGRDEDDVDEEYLFPAVFGGVVVETRLLQVGNGPDYRASVGRLGAFDFRATQIGIGARYVGNAFSEVGRYVVRQLAPRNRTKLEVSVVNDDFYFVGHVPDLKIDRQFG